jgi:hypothetical protein
MGLMVVPILLILYVNSVYIETQWYLFRRYQAIYVFVMKCAT